MEEEAEKLTAAQGLLDIAFKASQRSVDQQNSHMARRNEYPAQPSGLNYMKEARANSPTRIPAFRPIAPRGPLLNSGRVITSGNAPPVIKPKEDANQGFRPPDPKTKEKSFYQPKPRRPEPQERVTLIVAKKSTAETEADQLAEERDRKASFDLPVPRSAFAATGRVSAESIGPRPRLSDLPDPDGDSESDEENKKRGIRGSRRTQPPSKRSKMDRAVSINAALQQAGQDRLEDSSMPLPRSTQDFTSWSEIQKRQKENPAAAHVDTAEAAQRLWGAPPDPVYRPPPNIMPRNSSDKSTLDIHKQIAEQCSGETTANYRPLVRQGNNEAAERDQAMRQHPSALSAQTLIGSAPLPSDATDDKLPAITPASNPEATPRQDAARGDLPREETQNAAREEPHGRDKGFQNWIGPVKHRLKTVDGATSVAELFRIHAQVPAKLMEQIPPTIFVNVIVGRAQVKLGKHYVANCQLVNPTEEEIQKATALATRKLVAICELQHCTVTLVPHLTAEQGLRLVAFLITDE